MEMRQEASNATELLKGKVVEALLRHRKGEVVVKFTDGTTLFIDFTEDGTLEMSIT